MGIGIYHFLIISLIHKHVQASVTEVTTSCVGIAGLTIPPLVTMTFLIRSLSYHVLVHLFFTTLIINIVISIFRCVSLVI